MGHRLLPDLPELVPLTLQPSFYVWAGWTPLTITRDGPMCRLTAMVGINVQWTTPTVIAVAPVGYRPGATTMGNGLSLNHPIRVDVDGNNGNITVTPPATMGAVAANSWISMNLTYDTRY